MKDLTKKNGGWLSEDQLTELINIAQDTLIKHPSLRSGQAFFNTLHEKYPNIADIVRGTDLDPFYNAGILPDLYEYLTIGFPDK